MHPPVGFTFVFVSHYILQVPSLCFQKAKINSVLDWHHLHLNLRRRAAAEAEKVLASSLSTIENIWLKGIQLMFSGEPKLTQYWIGIPLMEQSFRTTKS
ncbi:unnamed protein product [Vicia faba]|uniref:Uncharacterized protein n=1 Tax=Vicia faba TaxID=3906 RepID=A0AAV0ZU49_VICFA|nr:unnamed protein product [Vicia faba]